MTSRGALRSLQRHFSTTAPLASWEANGASQIHIPSPPKIVAQVPNLRQASTTIPNHVQSVVHSVSSATTIPTPVPPAFTDVIPASLLDGVVAASEIRQRIKEDVAQIQTQDPTFIPGLAIVQVGNREDSNVYIRMKMKNAKDVGIYAQHLRLPRTTSQQQLLEEIERLNNEDTIHGIILQLPPESDESINSLLATNAIVAEKDVDGLTDENAGRLSRGDTSCIVPCTPLGCMDLIKRTGVQVRGSSAVVLGRSKIVGSPMADLLVWNDATVTKCHSRTRDLAGVCRQADILVAAVGRAEMVKGDWIKPGAVVIDCGINAIPDVTKKSGQRLVGDVDFSEAMGVASHITPVPGGVGPMTVALLLKNTLENAKKFKAKSLPYSILGNR